MLTFKQKNIQKRHEIAQDWQLLLNFANRIHNTTMKNRIVFSLVALFSISAIFTSCSKESEDTPISNIRYIKYEVSGDYSGNISMTYTGLAGQTVIDTIKSLPWMKIIPYSNRVDSISISGVSDDNSNLGTSGQKANVKITTIEDGEISSESTADGSGVINIPVLKYGFKN